MLLRLQTVFENKLFRNFFQEYHQNVKHFGTRSSRGGGGGGEACRRLYYAHWCIV